MAATAIVRPRVTLADEPTRLLRVANRTIEINGHVATVSGIFDDAGSQSFRFAADRHFRVMVDNRLDEPTLLHWHGLTPPWMQDGVPNMPHPPIDAGASHGFAFALGRPGTFWMHSHLGLQQQRLLAAPLIVEDPADATRDRQEIVLMLQDFSFRYPEEILAGLGTDSTAMQGMDHNNAMATGNGASSMAAMAGMAIHANDVDHDAYLANDRTLDDPQVVDVERAGNVRLRIINAAASTGFHVDTGALMATLVAVDGIDIVPIARRLFPLAMGQRIDLDLRIPGDGGSFPVLARREGASEQTGLILATRGASVPRLPAKATIAMPLLDLTMERDLAALSPQPVRPADRRLGVTLSGSHNPYRWRMDIVDQKTDHLDGISVGERIELVMTNRSAMPHPMHLHGHSFQVVDIGTGRFDGARRDTVQVPPGATVTVAFDADNPGRWAFHCHHLYHLAAGMMTTLDYRGSV